MKSRLLGAVVAGVALLFGGIGAGSVQAEEKIVIEGSSTVGPIAKAFAEFFMSNNQGVNITVNESGSGNGAKAIVAGTCDIATLSRFMKIEEFKAAVEGGKMPVAHVVAMDGIAIVVHPSNPVSAITMEQVNQIYSGKITNWKELGGADSPIVAISRDTSSGTYETFESLVMKKDKIDPKTEYVGSNGQMRARVQSTASAIGYVGLGFVDNSVKALPVNNVPATKRAVASGVYPIARPLYMFTDGYPKLGGTVHRFITVYLSPEGEAIINRLGFVPVTQYAE